ncbi:hypothetical protein QG37_00465 [Candidozyma auris]|uniref:Uncharacterized protein n=1 Tax=Candidozyma auris TaxID=498019 RepID=A0A0L0P771_CANAR|nr:hypothetical protein QG37_00465 [[Candida] auris]
MASLVMAAKKTKQAAVPVWCAVRQRVEGWLLQPLKQCAVHSWESRGRMLVYHK